MIIKISNLSHHFNFNYLFKEISCTINSGDRFAVLGPNGSGKSTFLRIILGQLKGAEGQVSYHDGSDLMDHAIVYKRIMLVSPALDLIEDFTLIEQMQFHFNLVKIKQGYSIDSIIDSINMAKQKDKYLKNFSSGMLQRLKLALAFYTDVDVLLLDEPTSNLDQTWINWYQEEIKKLKNQSIVVASNDEREYAFCDQKIVLES